MTRVIAFSGYATTIVPVTIPGVKTQVHTLSNHGQQPKTVAKFRLAEDAQCRKLDQILNGLHEARDGGFEHGQHPSVDRKENYPLSNLYLSLLQRMGIEAEKFSSGTATMRGLVMA